MFQSLKRIGRFLFDARVEILGVIAALLLVDQLVKIERGDIVADEREKVSDRVRILQEQIGSRIISDTHLLQGLKYELIHHSGWTQQDFEAYVTELIKGHPAILHIAVAQDYVITYFAPLAGNEQALGLDYRTIPAQLADLEKAIKLRRTVITIAADLAQGGAVIIGHVPYLRRRAGAKEDWGVIAIVWQIDVLFEPFSEFNGNGSYFAATRSLAAGSDEPVMVFGEAGIFDRDPVTTLMSLGSSQWEIAAVPRLGWSSSSPSIWMIRLIGLLTMSLLASMAVGRRMKQSVIRSLETEISERRQAEAMLRHSEGRLRDSEQWLRESINSMALGVVVIDERGTISQWNSCAEEIFGHAAAETIGKNVSMLMPEPNRSAHDRYMERYLRTGRAGIIGIGRDVTGIRKNGEEFPMHLGVGLVERDGRKQFIGSVIDLSTLVALQDQLRHAQRMEAVGQLTGGVAHDFNNLLAVIEGNLSLLGDDIEESRELSLAEVRESVLPALHASRRGAELTHRLLAFSRKQALRPEVLDINAVVEEVNGLLRRTLGESIDLGFNLGVKSWLAEADASQLEQVLLNLAINARDAMPEGGRLTIETGEVSFDDAYARSHSEVAVGDYVMLAVTDTGTGMDADTLEKVFEPFFTTKEAGKGTGLGLSMIYGFAKQSGGHVAVQSEPGVGTSVRLYLPRTAATATRAARKDRKALLQGGDETILIVEDDEDVRRMAARILTRLGYRVLRAEDGPAALNILQGEDGVDLLLTDVVLPGGMNGLQIAKRALKKTPGLKILYMSGYIENTVLHSGRLDAGVELIGKPFSYLDLCAKVREVLESAP